MTDGGWTPPFAHRVSVGSAAGEWRVGWPLVLIALVSIAIDTLPVFSLGVMMRPIQRSTGWSLAQISSGLLVQAVLSSLAGPIAGRAVDRFGIRRVAIPGYLALCVAIMSFRVFGLSYVGYLGAWMLASLAMPFAGGTVWSAAIARRFDRHRGLALGLAMCGTGIASASIPLILTRLNLRFDWRETYFVLGAWALILLPLMVFALRHQPEPAVRARGSTRTIAAPVIPIRLLLRSRHFVALLFAGFVLTMSTTTLTIHFVPLLIAKGLPAQSAAEIAGMIGLSSITGRVLTGLMLDRTSSPIPGALAFLLPAVTGLLLTFGAGTGWAAIAAIALGLGVGAEVDVIAYMTTRYFGIRGYGGVYGLVMIGLAIGVGAGPWLTSRWLDVGGSYAGAIYCLIPLGTLATLGLATLGRWRLVVPEPDDPSMLNPRGDQK